jgi:DNA ligase-1
MSEKLDGWRLGWTGADFILRGGGVLRVPDRWKRGMPTTGLDGELFAGAGNFNQIQRMIADGFHGLSFQVFDAVIPGPFRQRLAYLKTLTLPPHVQLLEHIRCRDTPHLIEFANAICEAGGEGSVVRDPRALYTPGRSGDVLRWVPQEPAMNRRRAF